MTAAIFDTLTREDNRRFIEANISHSCRSMIGPAFYIATYIDKVSEALEAMGWQGCQMTRAGNAFIVRQYPVITLEYSYFEEPDPLERFDLREV